MCYSTKIEFKSKHPSEVVENQGDTYNQRASNRIWGLLPCREVLFGEEEVYQKGHAVNGEESKYSTNFEVQYE